MKLKVVESDMFVIVIDSLLMNEGFDGFIDLTLNDNGDIFQLMYRF